MFSFFFFRAEDGIRDGHVTGVQTCALPISRSWSWSKRRGGLIVRASFSALNDVDPVSQVFREHMTLEAVENGTRRVYRQTHLSRMVFPQELRGLVELAGGFEFVQWFFGFKPHQVLEKSRHPLLMVVVLRRT